MKTKQHRNLLGLCVTLALVAPGVAFGQSKKEKELEARVAQLEQIVAQLQSQQQQTQTQVQTAQQQVDQVRVAQEAKPAAPANPKPIQSGTILPGANPGSSFSYGGFIKMDAMISDTDAGKIADGGAGRMFYLPSAIPVGGTAAVDPYTDFGAQFSRFWMSVDNTTEGGHKFKGYIEADFFGGGSANLGNETATNTHGITVRQAYVSWDKWMAGQAWSNFMDTAALPESVDFVGVTDGTIFVRQAQIRYTSGPWSFSAENPQTTVSPYFNPGARFNSGDNVWPDFTARWMKKGDWGHFTVAGLLRQYKVPTDYTQGGAISVSGRFNMGKNDDLRFAVNAGDGIGRYMAFGLGPDVQLDARGQLHTVSGLGGFVAWRHAYNAKLRSNLMLSAARFDNDTSLSGLGITRSAKSLHANLIYSPFPKLDVGAEFGWGRRTLENGMDGDLKRIQTTVKYSF